MMRVKVAVYLQGFVPGREGATMGPGLPLGAPWGEGLLLDG